MVFMPHWPKPLGSKPIDFGLERVLELLKRLGDPHKSIPPVVHFAGTNGKGSTIAFAKAMLEAAGYRVHTYTSPHLLNFNERINLAGKDISDDMLTQFAEECRIAADEMRITFYEGTTAMAFLAFSKVEADIVLLETGMGGRLDATNILERPLATVLTPISLDHTEYLGPDVQTIAREKIEIMRPGVLCISSLQFDEVHDIIEGHAVKLGAPLLSYGFDWVADKTADGMAYKNVRGDLDDLPAPALFGDHQIINASTAIAIMQNLKGFEVTERDIAEGLQKIKWPARMQQLKSGKLMDRLPDGWEIWLDGAHNNAGAHIVSCILDGWTDRSTYMICGFTKGRNVEEFFRYFKDKVDFVGTVLVQTEPSAQKAEDIAKAAQKTGLEAKPFENLEESLGYIAKLSDKPARIILCGSLYLASDALIANRL